MSLNDEQYLEEMKKDFLEEADEMISQMEENILELEKNPANTEAINEVFRAAHTLKGGSATVGFLDVQKFTHAMEDALSEIRDGTVIPTQHTTDILLKCLDVLTTLIDCRKNNTEYSGELESNVALARSIALRADNSAATPSIPKNITAPASLSETDSFPYQKISSLLNELELAEKENGPLYEAVITFNKDAEMVTVAPIQAYASLKDLGILFATNPDIETLQQDQFFPKAAYLFSTKEHPDTITEKVMLTDVMTGINIQPYHIPLSANEKKTGSFTETAPETGTIQSSPNQVVSTQELNSGITESPQQLNSPEKKGDSQATLNKKTSNSILRVDSERIDKMLNLVGELTVNKSGYGPLDASLQYSILTISSIFENLKEKMSLNSKLSDFDPSLLHDDMNACAANINNLREISNNLRTAFQQLDRITGDLRGHVMKIRMVTVGQIFNRIPRIVRDLSHQKKKLIEVAITGEATEMDKSVVEELLDPVIHIIRNSIDHGIETPEDRKKAGKPETGRLHLSAKHEGNTIIIKIHDDGKGIDAENVFQSAVKKGVVKGKDTLSQREKINLIFLPGFSTAKEVSSISGRGVGMDVVKTRIESLNGTATVETEPGKGTTMTLKLPLTLTIMQALLVRSDTEIYSIPITSIVETIRLEKNDFQVIEGKEVISVRDEVISVLHIDKVFNLYPSHRDEQYAVIVSQDTNKCALIVDELIGEQDIVIKAIKHKLLNVRGIAGAANLGDGTITFILDVNSFIDEGLKADSENFTEIIGN